MARLKLALRKRLLKVLKEHFPPPAVIRLEEHNGVYGIIISPQFKGMDSLERQDLIGDILAVHFTLDERSKILIVVAVTPDEETGYLASAR